MMGKHIQVWAKLWNKPYPQGTIWLVTYFTHVYNDTNMYRLVYCLVNIKFVGTVGCRYNAVKFLTNIHKRRHIARPLGRGMGCLWWIQHLIDIQPQFLQLFMQYLTILNRVITALDCICQTLILYFADAAFEHILVYICLKTVRLCHMCIHRRCNKQKFCVKGVMLGSTSLVLSPEMWHLWSDI